MREGCGWSLGSRQNHPGKFGQGSKVLEEDTGLKGKGD